MPGCDKECRLSKRARRIGESMKSLSGARNGDLFQLQGSGESKKFLLFHILALSRNEGFEILVAIVLTQTDCVRVHRRRS